MALLSADNLAGPGYIILNILRGMNIIALAAVVASSVVMLVKTFVVSKFFFFDATSHVITALAGLFLIVSECSLFRSFFARNWPLLSPSHGFITLGCAMMVLGLNMLGNMNKQATSQESLSLPFWRLLVASGILCIVIGFMNVLSNFIFRDKSRNITSRMVRSRGAMALSEADLESQHYDAKHKTLTMTTQHTESPSLRSMTHANTASPSMLRTGTPVVDCGSPPITHPEPAATSSVHHAPSNPLGNFDFSPLRAFRTARQSFLPSYHSASSPAANPTMASGLVPPELARPRPASSIYSRTTSGETTKKQRFWQRRRGGHDDEHDEPEVPKVPEISYPLNVNPQFAHLFKPDLGGHPSVRRHGSAGGMNKI